MSIRLRITTGIAAIALATLAACNATAWQSEYTAFIHGGIAFLSTLGMIRWAWHVIDTDFFYKTVGDMKGINLGAGEE